MDENFELEEGEAYHYKNDDENNVDPDIAFSYIDEKVRDVLGHFQKDFEGGVSAENLGAKFGGYGSFLPTYERFPVTWSRQKAPIKNPSPKKSPVNFTMEGTSQNLTAPSRVSPSVKHVTASCNSQSLNTGLPSRGVSHAKSAENFTSNDSKSGNPTDQRTLKFRIKIRSDHMVQKNAAIYNGLGLGDSPSSSLGSSSPENSEETLPVSQKTADESPTSIIRAMTSFPIPGCALMSPLHDSLLGLKRKENLSLDRKPVLSFKSNEEHSIVRVDKQDSVPGYGKLLKEREAKSIGKNKRPVGLKNENGAGGFNFEEESSFEEKTPGCREILSNGTKQTAVPNSVNVTDSVKGTIGTSKISIKARKDEVKGRLFSSDSVKDSLVSRSAQGSDEGGKHNACGNVTEDWGQNVENSFGDNSRLKGNNSIAPSKAYPKISKSDGNLNIEEIDLPKQGVGQKATQLEENGFNIPFMKKKPSLSGKKKLKSNNSGGKAVATSKIENLESIEGATPKNKSNSSNVSSSKNKADKLKPQKILMKVKDNRAEFPDIRNKMDSSDMPSSQKPKDTGFSELEIEKSARFNKSKDKFTIKNGSDWPMSRGSVKNSPPVGHDIVENAAGNGTISEIALPAVDLQVTQDWVCCDKCEKWRIYPPYLRDQLPDKWLCKMQSWLPPGLNQCDVSEDETNKFFDPAYQLPVTEGQNNVQNLGIGSVSRLSLTQAQLLDHNHNKPNLDVSPVGGKKKLGCRVTMKTGTSSGLTSGSDIAKNKGLQDTLKNRKLNDMAQPPADLNLLRKSSSQSLSKPKNLIAENQTPKQKAMHMNGGDVKKIKMKPKREADDYACEPSKKSKIGDMPQMNASRTGHFSSAGLPTNVSAKSMQDYNECTISEDARFSVSVKKQGVQTRDSLDTGSLDKMDGSVKKRKFKESQDNQNHINNTNSIKRRKLKVLQDNQNGENRGYENKESSDGGFREEKIRVPKTEARQSSINNADGRSNKKGMILKIHSSGSRDTSVVGMEETKGAGRQKIRRKISCQQPLDGTDSFRKDFGSAQVSTVATSSSSLVSGSRKTRGNVEEVKGSPVDSVSSSPMRSTRLKKLAAAGGGFILGRDDSVLGSLPAIDNSKIICKSKPSDFGNDYLQNGNADVVNGKNVLHSKHNVKVSDPLDKKEKLHLKKSPMYASKVDCNQDPPYLETACDGKPNFSSKSGIKSGKDEKNHAGMKNSVLQRSRDVRMDHQIEPKDNNHSSAKLNAQCDTSGKGIVQQRTSQEFEGESKATDPEASSGVSNIFSNLEDLGKQETYGHQTVSGSKQSVVASGNGDGLKASIQSDPRGGRDLNISSPGRVSTSQAASNALREAKDLRDKADRLKSSGFDFESNEAYFQAAFKFLQAASLVEASCSDSGIHGEMTHMQAYITSAKLCEDCAREYERRREMAAATLAYKCMEVAFMRVVYGKHPILVRDHNELQATLQMALQGESPSSSASDVDNLNNQATIDKSSSSKGSLSHANGNHVIVARHRSSIVKMLDLQQHVVLAMAASKKSLSAFAAAKITLEETQNSDCIDSVKRVIDFSFQDVEGLIRLIRLAVEDINRSCFQF